MPINKVPVVHKFGIISQSQRLELQERLLKQSYLKSNETKHAQSPTRNLLEVTEAFVQQYNAAVHLDEKEKYEDRAHKMLERIKRKAGLKDGGRGSHVDLPVAWTELSQLSQCKGKIQEDGLDVLITSLDQAPLHKSHIPALFFLAETTLYWLRTDAINQPYLRTAEIKLLKMGQMVFTRLFYHHMAGQLQGHLEFKNRLFTYLDGLSDSQEVYNPYPNALLCLRYINEVGRMIIGDANTDPGEVKEGDKVRSSHLSEDDQMFRDVSVGFGTTTQSSHTAVISSSVHDLSPSLWHALDVWRCTMSLSGGLQDALVALEHCGLALASESWVDGICAFQILADAAKTNIHVLRTLQNLCKGVATPIIDYHSPTDERTKKSDSNSIITKPSSQGAVSRTMESDPSQIEAGTPKYVDRKSEPSTSNHEDGYRISTATSKDEFRSDDDHGDVVKDSSVSEERRNVSSMESTMAEQVQVGTDINSGRVSEASSVPTFTNEPHAHLAGIHGWHWEVAIVYVDIITNTVLHGATSNIQKVALIGSNKTTAPLSHRSPDRAGVLASAGLVDMVYFRAVLEAADGSRNDWSWRVRYTAMQGLVKICRCCANDPGKEGIRTVAWNTLLKAHSLEKDTRVLEALKVGQVDVSLEKMLSQHLNVSPVSIGGKVAAGLSATYLPPLPPPVEPPKTPKTKPPPPATTSKVSPRQALRTTLKEEISLATALNEPSPTFEVRTSFDLKRIVEDQWRKELQKQLEEEDEELQKELEEQQKKEEEEQKCKEGRRREKLKGKYKGEAYDYSHVIKSNLIEGQTS